MQLEDAAARFAADLAALWPEEERTGPLGLAVSGGPDSLALMLLVLCVVFVALTTFVMSPFCSNPSGEHVQELPLNLG